MSRLSWLPLTLLLLAAPVRAGDPFHFPEAKHGTGQLRYLNNVPVLTVRGSPAEMGEAVGMLALKPAARVADYPRGLLDHFSAGALWKTCVATGKGMLRNFPVPYRDEMDALVRASGVDADKIIAGNTLFDIKKMVLCSALLIEADKSATGGPLLGRNLDYPSLGWVEQYTLVTVYRPAGKRAFATIGFPGLVGVLSGVNDAGLSIGVLEVFGARAGEGRFDARGIPYALCFRTLLEECATIDEARQRLEKMPRTTTLNLVVADRDHVGVLEITPRSVVLRKPEGGTLSCTNHFCTEVKPAKPIDMAHSFDRFDLLEKVRLGEKPVSVNDVRKQLDDVNLGPLTLQTMVFEPRTLKLHLAFGKVPSSAMPLRTLDLGPLLKGK